MSLLIETGPCPYCNVSAEDEPRGLHDHASCRAKTTAENLSFLKFMTRTPESRAAISRKLLEQYDQRAVLREMLCGDRDAMVMLLDHLTQEDPAAKEPILQLLDADSA